MSGCGNMSCMPTVYATCGTFCTPLASQGRPSQREVIRSTLASVAVLYVLMLATMLPRSDVVSGETLSPDVAPSFSQLPAIASMSPTMLYELAFVTWTTAMPAF